MERGKAREVFQSSKKLYHKHFFKDQIQAKIDYLEKGGVLIDFWKQMETKTLIFRPKD